MALKKLISASLLLTVVFSVQQVSAQKPVKVSKENSYLRIESSEAYEKTDLNVISIGVIGFENDMAGHMDLTYLDSTENGKGLTLDAGGGYAFNWFASFYLGLGIAVGYNSDTEDLIATYYPEAGIVMDITKSFGVSITKKRYFSLNSNTEDVIMLGLVFR